MISQFVFYGLRREERILSWEVKIEKEATTKFNKRYFGDLVNWIA
jgi:hypothetical protein